MQIDFRKICMREFLAFFWMPFFFSAPAEQPVQQWLASFVAHGKTTPAQRAKGADALSTRWIGTSARMWVPNMTRKVVKSPVTGALIISLKSFWWQLTHIDENITSHLCSWLVHPPLVNSATCYIQHFADKVEDPTASICIVHLSKEPKSWLWRVQIPWFRVIPQCLK